LRARFRYWSPEHGDYLQSAWTQSPITLAQQASPAIDSISVDFETVLGREVPTLTGLLEGADGTFQSHLASIQVEFFAADTTVNANSVPVRTVFTDSTGAFEYSPTGLNSGQNELQARTVINLLDGSSITGNVFNYQFTLSDPSPTTALKQNFKVSIPSG